MNDAEGLFAIWAGTQGWVVSHRGWPDYLCRRGAEVMVVEVKDKGDWLSHEQRANMIDLHALGLPTFVWTPGEGLMAFPKIQDNLLLTRLEMAYELEKVKAERDDLRVAKEHLHTQLALSNKLVEAIKKERLYRRIRFGKDFKIIRRWAAVQPDLPAEIVDMLKHYAEHPTAAT